MRRVRKRELAEQATFQIKENKILERISELELRITLHPVPASSAEEPLLDAREPSADKEVTREPTALEIMKQALADEQLALDRLQENCAYEPRYIP